MARKQPPSLTSLPTYKPDGSDFGDWVITMPATFMGCRDFGHVWRALTAKYDEQHKSFTRRQQCTRCKAFRTQTLGLEGSIDRNQYEYPEGYQAPAGSGPWDKDARAAVRLASTLKMMAD